VLQRAESLALGLLAALLLVDAVRMTPLFPLLMSRLVPVMSGDYGRALGLAMAATVLLAILAHAGTALGTSRNSFWAAFSQISAAILPIAFAAQLALSAQHMMATPEALRNLLAELTLLDPGHMPPPTAYSSLWALKLFQIALLLAGAIIGARIARNTTHRWRSTAYAVGTTVLFVALFLQPMSVTC
ncbi:MAG TPA: hypothetical protein VF960_14035, partial [Chloroflexota bacterium]